MITSLTSFQFHWMDSNRSSGAEGAEELQQNAFNSIEWIRTTPGVGCRNCAVDSLSIPLNGFGLGLHALHSPLRLPFQFHWMDSLSCSTASPDSRALSIPLNGFYFSTLLSTFSQSLSFQFHWMDSQFVQIYTLEAYPFQFHWMDSVLVSTGEDSTVGTDAAFNSIEWIRRRPCRRFWRLCSIFQFHWMDS